MATTKARQNKKSAKKATVVESSFDAAAIAAMLADATPEELGRVSKAANTVKKQKVEKAKAAKAQEKLDKARNRIHESKAGMAIFKSYLYPSQKTGALSRKVWLESDQTFTRYTKGGPVQVQHSLMLKEADIAALACIIKTHGVESLGEVILAAAADKDLQLVG